MYVLAKTVCFCCNQGFCDGLGRCCHSCLTCGGCLCPHERPSPIFLVYTILLCAIPAAMSVVVAVPNFGACHERNVPGFLLGSAALNIMYVVFAFYIYSRFSRPYDAAQPHDRNPFSRAWHTCCFDPWVSLFILGFVGGIVLGIYGIAAMADVNCGSKENVPKMAKLASVLLLVYLFGSTLVIFLSLGVECLRRGSSGSDQTLQSLHGSNSPGRQGSSIVDRLNGVVGRLFYPLSHHTPHFAPPAPPSEASAMRPGYLQQQQYVAPQQPYAVPQQPYALPQQQPYPSQLPNQGVGYQGQYQGGRNSSGWVDKLRSRIPFGNASGGHGAAAPGNSRPSVDQANFGPPGLAPSHPPYGSAATGSPAPPPATYQSPSPYSNYSRPAPPPLGGPSAPPLFVANVQGGGKDGVR